MRTHRFEPRHAQRADRRRSAATTPRRGEPPLAAYQSHPAANLGRMSRKKTVSYERWILTTRISVHTSRLAKLLVPTASMAKKTPPQ
jgi:hypothetical protein